ncbi:hypothetical protein AAMO2058_000442600 [Amorphochlora amoebiformis]
MAPTRLRPPLPLLLAFSLAPLSSPTPLSLSSRPTVLPLRASNLYKPRFSRSNIAVPVPYTRGLPLPRSLGAAAPPPGNQQILPGKGGNSTRGGGGKWSLGEWRKNVAAFTARCFKSPSKILKDIFFTLAALLILSSGRFYFSSVSAIQKQELPYSEFIQLVQNAGSKGFLGLGTAAAEITDVRFSPRRIDFMLDNVLHYTRPIGEVGTHLIDLLTQKGITFSAMKVNMLAATITALLPIAFFTIIWSVVLSKMIGGGNDNGAVGRMIPPPAVPTGGFDMVAGIDEPKNELVEIVDFLKRPQRYVKTGARLPKGVLMVGEPGTGKTLLARAMAGEAGVPFYYCSGSEFIELYVGRGASRLRSLFKRARASAPCVLFVDELDALGKRRDQDTSRNGVIVLGATNRPEVLDPALCRPGRFDRIVKIEKPNKEGRIAILRVHTKEMKLSTNVDLDELAKLTPGYTGAELEGVCNEAAIRSVRRRDEESIITRNDFLLALENFERSRGVLAGNPLTKRIGSAIQSAFGVNQGADAKTYG